MAEAEDLAEAVMETVKVAEAVAGPMVTATGRAMAGLLSIFAEFEREILRERVKAGIAHARSKGKSHGRPATAKKQSSEILSMFNAGLSKSEISRKLGIGRTSVRRIIHESRT